MNRAVQILDGVGRRQRSLKPFGQLEAHHGDRLREAFAQRSGSLRMLALELTGETFN